MGARIVLACLGSYGDLFPYIGLARELRLRGHVPVLATAPAYREIVGREGLAFHPVPPDLDPTDRAIIARVMHARDSGRYIVKELVVPTLREAYAATDAAAEGADLLVTHPLTFTAPLVAEKRGMRWVSTVLAPSNLFSRYDIPIPPHMPWWNPAAMGPTVGGWLRALMARITTPWFAPVARLRAELGLPDRGHPFLEAGYSPWMTLALFPSVLSAQQPDWPHDTRRTGFVSYSGPDGMPPELTAFLDAGEPPITFTLGTSAVGVAGRFFHESAEAVRQLGRRGVLLVGKVAENRPERLPEGVIAVEFAPHAALFPRSAAIVHQCGMGTLSQALRAGKPQLAVPFANDQPDNAARVNRLGVARVCRPTRYESSRVARELEALLAQAQYATRAASVGRIVMLEDGARAACDAIEEVLNT